MNSYGKVCSGRGSLGVLFVCILFLCFSPAPAVSAQDTFLEWDLSGDIPDEKSPFVLPLPGFEQPQPSTLEVLKILDRAGKDRRVAGLILKVKGPAMGMAKLQEIREALLSFQKRGKKIYSYAEGLGNTGYYFVSSSDRISLHPSGNLFLVGLAMQATFLRGTLDLLGVHPEFHQIGKYKSAADSILRRNMSDAHREVTNAILDDMYDQLTGGIAHGRGMAQDLVKEIIDTGPFTARTAKKNGLVDVIEYEDEFQKNLDQKHGGRIRKIDFDEYLGGKKAKGLFEVFFSSDKPQSGKKIAVIFASGSIVSGKSQEDFLQGKVMGSESMAELIRKARKDETVKAIVFRIDSPGGSGLASDVIYRETLLAKKKKPFVVSMSNVAGSGGYYIAMGAHKIIAEPGTITGSIGVLGGKFNLSGLYKKIGLGVEVVTRGKNADFFSSVRSFTPEQQKKFEDQMWVFYKDFAGKVAKGRGKTFDEIDAIARGRIWTGRQGLKNGLVDDLGGLSKAISIAKEMAGISEKAKVDIVTFPEEKNFFDMIKEWFQVRMVSNILPVELRGIFSELSKKKLLEKEPILLQMPYTLRVE